MSLPGEEREMMRVQPSPPLGYNNNNNINSLDNPPQKSRSSEPYSKPKPGNPPRISYRECLKNHAANVGGNVTDGCGEFMPSGGDGTLDALKCAACSCHRNFHRRDSAATAMVLPPPLPSPSMSHHRGGAGNWSAGTDSSSEERNFNSFHSMAVAPPPPQLVGKKRFRTKFTAEQKEKMLEFAEKVGWRIPREDDAEVQRFCAQVGVKRQVFKVWMHNNKTSSSKKINPQGF